MLTRSDWSDTVRRRPSGGLGAGRRCDDAVARQQASQPVPAGTIMFQCGEMAAVPPGGTNGNFILLLIVISQEFTAIIIFQIITFFNEKMALIILAHASLSG